MGKAQLTRNASPLLIANMGPACRYVDPCSHERTHGHEAGCAMDHRRPRGEKKSEMDEERNKNT